MTIGLGGSSVWTSWHLIIRIMRRTGLQVMKCRMPMILMDRNHIVSALRRVPPIRLEIT